MALWICYQTLERARPNRHRKKTISMLRVFIILEWDCSVSNGKHINYSNPNEWALHWEREKENGWVSELEEETLAASGLALISLNLKRKCDMHWACTVYKYTWNSLKCVVERPKRSQFTCWRAKNIIFYDDYYAVRHYFAHRPSHKFPTHPVSTDHWKGIYSFLKCNSFGFVVVCFFFTEPQQKKKFLHK